MALVPYQEAPTVAPRVEQPFDYQTERATPEAFGGAVGAAEQRTGQQVQQTGANLIDIATLKQERFNQVASDDAWNQFQQGSFNLTYGDPNGPKDPNGNLLNPGIYGMKGSDALRQYPITTKALDDLRTQISGGLQNDAQRIQFDQSSRRLQMFTMDSIGRHVDEQSNIYGIAVNDATTNNQKQAIAADPDNDIVYGASSEEMKRAAVQKAQILYGTNLSPQLTQAALTHATADAVTSRVLAWAPNNPTRAEQFLKANQSQIPANIYDALLRTVQGHAQTQDVQGRTQAIMGGQTTAPPASGDIYGAIQGQEGSGPQAVSPAGAAGTMQVTPGFFQKYAHPGENFDNEADRVTVSHRGIDALEQQYGGDHARVAVAYFSGEGNVAPAGSPVPWIVDKRDAGGTSTSSYVAGVLARMPYEQEAQKPYVVGDSIASGIRMAGRYDGAVQIGASPQAVLASVTALPDAQVKGRDIILSSGASNNPAQVQLVSQQVQTLKAKGAASVTLMGVGDRSDLSGVNDNLMQIAQQTGARFVPLAPGNLSPDRVHPQDYGSVATSALPPRQQAREQLIPDSYMDDMRKIGEAGRQAATMDPVAGERLVNNVYTEIAKKNALQDRAIAAAEKVRRDAAEDAGNSVVNQLIAIREGKADPGSFNPDVITSNPYLDPKARWDLFNMSQTVLKGEGDHDVKTYGTGFYTLYQQVHAPQGAPNRITDPAQLYSHVGPNGDLTISGVEKLTQEIQSRRTPEGEAEGEMRKAFLANAHNQIAGRNDTYMLKDPKGDELYLKFLAQALPAYDEGRKSGKTAAQLLDPGSKDYVGASIGQFKRDPTTFMNDMINANKVPETELPGATQAPVPVLNTPEDVSAALHSGKIDYATAANRLRELGFQHRAAPVTPTAPASLVPTNE